MAVVSPETKTHGPFLNYKIPFSEASYEEFIMNEWSQGAGCHKYRLFMTVGRGEGSVSSVHQDSGGGASKNSSRHSLAVSSGENTVKPMVRGSLKIS